MLHPDYQYTPKLMRAMVGVLVEDVYDIALGSRILGNGALEGGMPLYKYVANRCLTAFENIVIGQKLSEYHTGLRAYPRRVLEAIPVSTQFGRLRLRQSGSGASTRARLPNRVS